MAIDKFIKDLYGYSTTDRLTMFGEETEEKEEEFDETEFEILDDIDVQGTLNEINTADTLSELNKADSAQRARLRVQKEQAGIK